MLKGKTGAWQIACLASWLVCIALFFVSAHFLIQNGILRDEQGLTGEAPFFAGTGLWLALLLPVVTGIVAFVAALALPKGRWDKIGAAMVGGVTLALGGYCAAIYLNFWAWQNTLLQRL